MSLRGDRLRRLLRSPRSTDRSAARQEIAEALSRNCGDAILTARTLGLDPRTVRRWSVYPGALPRTDSIAVGEGPAVSAAGGTRPEAPPEWARPVPAEASPATTVGRTNGPTPGVAPASSPTTTLKARRLAFVLHAHLPWVIHHGTWPHGEDWLHEVAAASYLPLIAMLRARQGAGARNQLTVTMSPVLVAQLKSDHFRRSFSRYLRARGRAARDASDWPLASWWENRYSEVERLWRELEGDIVGALRELARDGVIEVGTCAATHAYLPLLHDSRTVALELELAARTHESAFGFQPAGFWLPECAYRPGGPWFHPVSGAWEADRPGIEWLLERSGFAWTVLDAHQLVGGSPIGYRGALATRGRSAAELHRPHSIGSSRVVAFVRDPELALEVWSRENGYPGEPVYLDFHKRHWPSGLRFWRVTDARADLAEKLPYEPRLTAAAVAAQANHFVTSAASVLGPSGGCVTAPFDAELFGHWWFEGVSWLEEVLRRCDASPQLETTTPSRELAANSRPEPARFREGSWGDGGDHRMWLNGSTEPLWREAARLEPEALRAATGVPARWRGAIINELLLLLASDWSFLVTTDSARDYALARFREHGRQLRTLVGGEKATLPKWCSKNAVFPTDLLDEAWRRVT